MTTNLALRRCRSLCQPGVKRMPCASVLVQNPETILLQILGSNTVHTSQTTLDSAPTLRMSRRRCVAFAASSAWLGQSVAAAQASQVRLGGTGSATGIAQLLGQGLARTQVGFGFDVLPALGSPGGISALLDGKLDVALANRAPNDAERARGSLVWREIAHTPFVVATHRKHKLTGLSAVQLAALYSDVLAKFPNGLRARAVLRLADNNDSSLLKAMGSAMPAAIEAAHARPGMLNANTDSETADLIEKTPGAFGPSTLGQMLSESRPFVALSIDGKVPSVEGLRTRAYPWFKPIFWITRDKPSASTVQLTEFVASAAGRRILDVHGYRSL
jgi:phosphate transport system substrate-binding protein